MDDFELESTDQDAGELDDVLDHSYFVDLQDEESDDFSQLMMGELFTSDHLLREL